MEIYIHLPFCKSKCAYCDFNSYAECDKGTVFSFISALLKEIEFAGKQYKNAKIDTVYIGGGTPSLPDAADIKRICDMVFSSFECDIKEFTIECNPESITEEKLEAYKECGIDRLSIGVQSLDDNNLRSVGRIHNAELAISKLKLANKYFDNVSCDLIIGLPYDTAASVKAEIETLLPFVKHISMYELEIAEGTPLAKRVANDEVLLPNDDEVQDFFDIAIATAASRGFKRYEVSNFALEGYLSKHNYGYWTREEYLGFGAGAHSYVRTLDGMTPLNGEPKFERSFDAEMQSAKELKASSPHDLHTHKLNFEKSVFCKKENFGHAHGATAPSINELRFSSPRDLHAYIAGINCVDEFFKIPRAEISPLDENEIRKEKIMLGLRTHEGIDVELLRGADLSRFNEFFSENGDRVILNDKGLAIMNSIIVELI